MKTTVQRMDIKVGQEQWRIPPSRVVGCVSNGLLKCVLKSNIMAFMFKIYKQKIVKFMMFLILTFSF